MTQKEQQINLSYNRQLNSTMVQSSLNNSMISRSVNNSRGIANANRQTILNILSRPQTAAVVTTSLTPALAFKRQQQAAGVSIFNNVKPNKQVQAGYNPVRQAKTPGKARSTKKVQNRGSKSTSKANNINQTFDVTSKPIPESITVQINSRQAQMNEISKKRVANLAYAIQGRNVGPSRSYAQLSTQKKSVKKSQRGNAAQERPQYESNSQTFGVRSLSHYSSNTPAQIGPGVYEPKISLTKERSPSALILGQDDNRNGVRISNDNDTAPGQYAPSDLNNFGKDAIKISIHPKLQTPINNRNPGPGYYNPSITQVKESAPKASISPSKSQAQSFIVKEQNPGPGSYDFTFKNTGLECPTYTISGSKRLLHQSILSPGPGQYNPGIKPVRESSPEYTFGQKNSSHKKSLSTASQLNPGPGYYVHKPIIGNEGPQYSIQPTLEPRSRDRAPGPGFYNPNDVAIKEKVKAFKFTQSEKKNYKKKHTASWVPPPGSYDPMQKNFGRDGPKYSFLSKSKSRQELSPGPGQYNPGYSIDFAKYKPVGVKISQPSKVPSVNRNAFDTPGPGYYQTIEHMGKDGLKKSILAKPAQKVSNCNPGPGQYQPNTKQIKASPAAYGISQGKRVEIVSKEKKIIPGPGYYESPTRVGTEGPKVLIHAKLNDGTRNLNPGPGYYNPTEVLVRERSPKYTIDQNAQRLKSVSKERLQSPGPGTYDYATPSDQPKYSIGMKYIGRNDNGVPGPGNYNPNTTVIHETIPGKSFTKTDRASPVHQDARDQPGPGYYEAKDNRYSSLNYKVSLLERQSPVSRDARLNPGPGQYQSPTTFGHDGLHYTIAQKHLLKSYDQLPAPGQYDPLVQVIQGRSPLAKINPIPSSSPQAKYSPGPGHYYPFEKLTRNRSPEYGMGGLSNRPGQVSPDQRDNPGPGHYYHDGRSLIGGPKSLKYSIGIKPYTKDGNGNPAPGQYDPNDSFVKMRSPSHKLSQSMKGLDVPHELRDRPGPGVYDPVDKRYLNISYTISNLQRLSPVGRDARFNPGPAHYSSPYEFGDDGLHYSMGIKSPARNPDNFPGPGYYEGDKTAVQRRSPLAKIFPEGASPSGNNNPGPGQYNPNDILVKERSPQYRIGGLTQRMPQVSNDLINQPGPGYYPNPTLIGGPDSLKYTIGQKPNDPSDSNYPGPAHYHPDDRLAHQKSPEPSFSKMNRPGAVPNEELYKQGPGTYDPLDQRYANIAYKFGIGERPDQVSRDARANPGPGHYTSPDTVGKDAPQYTMGAKVVPGFLENFPGPGYYDPSTSLVHQRSPLGKINPVEAEVPIKMTPGPGQYNPNDDLTHNKSPDYTIGGLTQRMPAVSNDLINQPGPGHYPQQTIIGGPDSLKFTIGAKLSDPSDNNYPGPGYYSSPDLVGKDAPHYTMGAKSPEGHRDDFPAPGQYDPSVALVHQRTPYGFMNPYHEEQGIKQSPGPGHYNPNDVLTHPLAPSYNIVSFGNRLPQVSSDQLINPGPGYYPNPTLIGGPDSLKYTIGQKPNDPSDNNYPGPAHYHPDDRLTHDKAPEPTFSQLDRQSQIPSEEKYKLGPGYYDPIDNKYVNISYQIPQGDRPDTVPRDARANPGPGHYAQSDLVGVDAPKYTIGERVNVPHGENFPAPGQYGIPNDQFAHQKVILGVIHPEAQAPRIPETPGPATYHPDDALGHNRSPSYNFGMGNDRPDGIPFDQKTQPGPGHYDPNDSLVEPRSPLGKINPIPGFDGPVKDTPGPGTYDPEYSAVKERAPSAKVAKCKRDFLTVSGLDLSQPGPGHYDANLPGNSQSFTIGEKLLTGPANNNPGPCSYAPTHSQTEHKSPSHDFSRSPERVNDSRNETGVNLGPGSYDRKFDFVSGNTSLQYSIPQGDRDQRIAQSPGPGDYKIPVKFAAQKLFAIPYINEEFKYV